MEFGDFISELLQRTDILRVISRYTQLQKRGGTYWGCCPFHHEKTPSFSVSPDRGLYHCFGCKAGGNVITFLSEIESIERMEAIRILAKEAGMEMPEYKRKDGQNYADVSRKKERLYTLMREAARHYHDNLSLPQASAARQYLEGRGIDERLVRRFGLGYSVSGREMLDYLRGKGYTYAEMKDAGIAAQRADEYYDVFYERLIIPIINHLGEVVSFGGRVLQAKPEFAKYRNGSQTLIFDKSHNIYAVNLLKKKKQAGTLQFIVMTEGYMDVISLHKAGFDMAVASMGTALTGTQAKLLKNYCDRIYISYDGDGAGQKATLRGLDILAEAGLKIRVVRLPEGLDPDDVVNKMGAEAYQKLLDEAVTLPQFKIDTLARKYDITQPDEKANFTVEALKVVKALPNPAEREAYIAQIRKMTGYTWDSLYKQMELSPPDPVPDMAKASAPAAAAPLPPKDDPTEVILASILDGRYCDFTLDIFPYLHDDLSRRIYEWGLQAFRTGEKKGLSEFYERTPEADMPRLKRLLDYEFSPEGDHKANYADCVRKLQIQALLEEKASLLTQAGGEKETAVVRSYMERVKAIDGQIRKLRSGARDDDL